MRIIKGTILVTFSSDYPVRYLLSLGNDNVSYRFGGTKL